MKAILGPFPGGATAPVGDGEITPVTMFFGTQKIDKGVDTRIIYPGYLNKDASTNLAAEEIGLPVPYDALIIFFSIINNTPASGTEFIDFTVRRNGVNTLAVNSIREDAFSKTVEPGVIVQKDESLSIASIITVALQDNLAKVTALILLQKTVIP